MDVHISLTGRGDLAAQIYQQLRDAILDGRLRTEERLPPTRELARELEVSRNTVAVAYDRLTSEGFLVARVGAGTFVGGEALDHVTRSGDSKVSVSRTRALTGHVRPRTIWQEVQDAGGPPPPVPVFDFRTGTPDTQLFPMQAWRRLVGRELRTSALEAGHEDPVGHPKLRAAIARYFGLSRSLRTGPEDVIVTRGAQQALDLIGRVLIEPGDVVAVENPGYSVARQLFRSLGAQLTGVPVDDEGIVVDALPARARLIYVTPSHQFPSGAAMSIARRSALLTWAERHDAVIVEDDYDSEIRFSKRPLEPLQSLDGHGRVIYVNTFSKTLAPMLRIGFLIAPGSLQPALRQAKRLTDLYSEVPTQAALARFIDEGLLARHIRRCTRVYAARRESVTRMIRDEFGEWLTLAPSSAGLHLCARLLPTDRLSLDHVVQGARSAGVAVETLAQFTSGPCAQDGLVVGYGAIQTDRIPQGLRRLARVFHKLTSTPGGVPD